MWIHSRVFALFVMLIVGFVMPAVIRTNQSTPSILSAQVTPEVNPENTAEVTDALMYTARALEIDLGEDFTTQAELTLPLDASENVPVVVLLHGSGPYDLDANVPNADGTIRSSNFRLIAATFAEQGIAVLRFNKRGVLGDGNYDFAQIQASTLDRLVADANAVIDAALMQQEIDADQVYVYGWSEGGVVAANVAAARDDIAGIILQGTPNGDVGTVIPYQHLELGLPYLADVTDADGDGALSLDEIATLSAGSVQLMGSFYLFDFTSTPQNPVISTRTDSNGDGLIQLEAELRPAIEFIVDNFASFLPPSEATWQTGELLVAAGVPVLLLHGTTDGWVPVTVVDELQAADPERVTVNVYEGLGHALSPTDNPALDAFDAMDAAPINDMAAWINGATQR